MDYMPFGEMMREDNVGGTSYQYTGQEFDKESGIHNYRARLYDSDLGRFYGMPARLCHSGGDPQEQFASPFSYAGNNPVMYTDPNGEYFGIDDAIIAGVAGLVNLGVNLVQGNVGGLGEAASYFGVGAASAITTMYAGPLAGAAVLGLGNDITQQVSLNGWGNINWTQAGIATGVGALTAWAGGHLSNQITPVVSKAISNTLNPMIQDAIVQGVSNAATGFILGTGVSLFSGNNMTSALKDGLSGGLFGLTMGVISGSVSGYKRAKSMGYNALNGKRIDDISVKQIAPKGANTSTSPPVQKPIAGTGRVGVRDAMYVGGDKTISTGDFAGKNVTVKQLTLSHKQLGHFGKTAVSGKSYLTKNPNVLLGDLNSNNFTLIRLNSRGMPIVKFNYSIGNVIQQGTGTNLGVTQYGTVHLNGSGQVHIVPWLFR